MTYSACSEHLSMNIQSENESFIHILSVSYFLKNDKHSNPVSTFNAYSECMSGKQNIMNIVFEDQYDYIN